MEKLHTPAPWNWMYWKNDNQVVYNVKPIMRPIDGQIENKADAILIAAAPEMFEAINRIFEEPYGCPFCDSGILRGKKPHAPECGFELARRAVEKATANKPSTVTGTLEPL